MSVPLRLVTPESEYARLKAVARSVMERMPSKRRSIFDFWGWGDGTSECWYCGVELLADGTWHIEHQHPRSRGGSDHPDNLVPACVECNRSKADLTVEEFRERVWRRYLDIITDAFNVIQKIPDGLFCVHLSNGKHIGVDELLVDVADWIKKAGPAAVRFSGDDDGERFVDEPLERATLGMMRGAVGLPAMTPPVSRYQEEPCPTA